MSRRSERLVGLCLWHKKFYKISDIDDEDEEGDGDGDGHGCHGKNKMKENLIIVW